MTTAFVFPGQGSQSVGMLRDFDNNPIIQQTFEEASDTLEFDLWGLIQQGPENDLNSTNNTQPALLASSIALYRLWQSKSELAPTVMAGHSLGEYSALVAADVIAFSDAIALVRTRGELMQAAVPENTGAMAAILGLDDEAIIDLCEQFSNEEAFASAANFNMPGQVVIAGHKAVVDAVLQHAKDAGAKRSVLLPVSVPSHCVLMQQAADDLNEVITNIEFSDASIPVIQNVDAAIHNDTQSIKEALVEQLFKPVQWIQCVENLSQNHNIDNIIECGPGKVLSGLVRRIDKTLNCLPILDETSLDKAIETLQ